MKRYIVPKKKVKECDGGCPAGPVDGGGMGPVVPGMSGDRWDNILGVGFPKPKKKKE